MIRGIEGGANGQMGSKRGVNMASSESRRPRATNDRDEERVNFTGYLTASDDQAV